MSNYYKKYLKYKLKYLEAKKSMSGGGASGSTARGRESPPPSPTSLQRAQLLQELDDFDKLPLETQYEIVLAETRGMESPLPSPRGMEELLEADIEKVPSDDSDDSDDDKFEITLRNNPKEELEYILKVDKSTTIYELKIRLLRELNFGEYEGRIDLDSFIRIYYAGDEIGEDNLETNNIDGENLLTFEYFEDLLIVPVFYDISDYRDKRWEESDDKERDNLRKLLEKIIPDIKNGDIVYARSRGDESYWRCFYIYFNKELIDISPVLWRVWKARAHQGLMRLRRQGRPSENEEGDIIESIYEDFKKNILNILPYEEHNDNAATDQMNNATREDVNLLNFRPVFFNIINWSNSDKNKNRINPYFNLYEMLNETIMDALFDVKSMSDSAAIRDRLANMEEIKKFNKYSDSNDGAGNATLPDPDDGSV